MYLSPWGLRFMTPHCITRPQCVNRCDEQSVDRILSLLGNLKRTPECYQATTGKCSYHDQFYQLCVNSLYKIRLQITIWFLFSDLIKIGERKSISQVEIVPAEQLCVTISGTLTEGGNSHGAYDCMKAVLSWFKFHYSYSWEPKGE